jgi:hypothetical protein
MLNLDDAVKNTKMLYLTNSALTTLMDFERVLDEQDVYSFKHWKQGELVEGPLYEKYFVSCKFMWPVAVMPDPNGGKRLLELGCKMFWKKGVLRFPVTIKTDADYRDDGSHKPEIKEVPVWFVNIIMPRELVSDIKEGSLEIEGKEVDLQQVESAFDEGMMDQANVDTSETDEEMEDVGTGAEEDEFI